MTADAMWLSLAISPLEDVKESMAEGGMSPASSQPTLGGGAGPDLDEGVGPDRAPITLCGKTAAEN